MKWELAFLGHAPLVLSTDFFGLNALIEIILGIADLINLTSLRLECISTEYHIMKEYLGQRLDLKFRI